MSKLVTWNVKGKFTLWEMEVGINFNLDFSTFVSRFNLTTGLILHWQSKPPGYREWGIYDIVNDSYLSCPHFEPDGNVNITPLELDDKSGFVPSAVIYFPDGKISQVNEDNSVIIGKATYIPQPQPNPEFNI